MVFMAGDDVRGRKNHSMIWGSLVAFAALNDGGEIARVRRSVDMDVRVTESDSDWPHLPST